VNAAAVGQSAKVFKADAPLYRAEKANGGHEYADFAAPSGTLSSAHEGLC